MTEASKPASIPTFGHNNDPTSGFTGDSVIGFNLNGSYENNSGVHDATTPEINIFGLTDLTLSFQRWLAVESNSFDHAEIEFSVDDGPWRSLWSNPSSSIIDAGWTEVMHNVPAQGETIRFRWSIGPTDSSWVFAGWNIDDVVVTGKRSTVVQPESNYDISIRDTVPPPTFNVPVTKGEIVVIGYVGPHGPDNLAAAALSGESAGGGGSFATPHRGEFAPAPPTSLRESTLHESVQERISFVSHVPTVTLTAMPEALDDPAFRFSSGVVSAGGPHVVVLTGMTSERMLSRATYIPPSRATSFREVAFDRYLEEPNSVSGDSDRVDLLLLDVRESAFATQPSNRWIEPLNEEVSSRREFEEDDFALADDAFASLAGWDP